jgi:hypothetical protein
LAESAPVVLAGLAPPADAGGVATSFTSATAVENFSWLIASSTSTLHAPSRCFRQIETLWPQL